MKRIEALMRFIWDFVVGDDWRIAAVVVVALIVTAVLADAIAAWWILPVAVACVLGSSLRHVARSSRPS